MQDKQQQLQVPCQHVHKCVHRKNDQMLQTSESDGVLCRDFNW